MGQIVSVTMGQTSPVQARQLTSAALEKVTKFFSVPFFFGKSAKPGPQSGLKPSIRLRLSPQKYSGGFHREPHQG